MASVQFLALFSMLVDHLGAVGVFDTWARFIGRLALPAFVFMVAYNALYTSRPGVMVKRLVVLLLISQPLWWLSVGTWGKLCILVTLLAIVLLVWRWRCRDYYSMAVLVAVVAVLSPWLEYGIAPLLLVPVVLTPAWWALALALVWPFAQYGGAEFQLLGLFAVVGILLLVRLPELPRLPRLVTRWFYPAHLFILVLIFNA